MRVEKLIWQSDQTDHLAYISGLCQIAAYAHDDLSCEMNQSISRKVVMYLAEELCLVLGPLALMGGCRSRRLLKAPDNSETFLFEYFVEKKRKKAC